MRHQDSEMSIIQGKVLLCKAKVQGESEDGDKGYAKVLESAGFTCDHLSILKFEFVNLDNLQSLLLAPHLYSGLILTSPRSAEAVRLALGEQNTKIGSIFNKTWSQLPIYCVGAATERITRELLNVQNCRGSETGNAKDLALLIVQDAESGTSIANAKPLLYPCSIIARDTMAVTLEAAGITLSKLPVYQTLPSETLVTDLNELLFSSPPEYLVLFSPSAVKHIMNVVDKNKQNALMGLIKLVAIGPVTEQAILNAGLQVYTTSKQPEPVALANALKEKLLLP